MTTPAEPEKRYIITADQIKTIMSITCNVRIGDILRKNPLVRDTPTQQRIAGAIKELEELHTDVTTSDIDWEDVGGAIENIIKLLRENQP